MPIQGSKVAMLRGRQEEKCGRCGSWQEREKKGGKEKKEGEKREKKGKERKKEKEKEKKVRKEKGKKEKELHKRYHNFVGLRNEEEIEI